MATSKLEKITINLGLVDLGQIDLLVQRASTPIAPMSVFHGDGDTTVHPRNADHLLEHWATSTAGGRYTTNGPMPRAAKHQGTDARRARLHLRHLPRRRRSGHRGAVEHPRARTCLVRQEPRWLVQ